MTMEQALSKRTVRSVKNMARAGGRISIVGEPLGRVEIDEKLERGPPGSGNHKGDPCTQ